MRCAQAARKGISVNAKPFLITGQPRARTAWLSVLCSTGASMCYHEPSGGMGDISELKGVFDSDFYKFVGVSDSIMGFFLDWIFEHIAPRTVIVERDPGEVLDSLSLLGLPRTNLPYLLRENLERFKDHPLVMWVPFDALETKRIVQRVFWHLMPGEPFDENRYDLLAKMRIETDRAKTFEMAFKHRSQHSRLLRDILPKIKLTEPKNERAIH